MARLGGILQQKNTEIESINQNSEDSSYIKRRAHDQLLQHRLVVPAERNTFQSFHLSEKRSSCPELTNCRIKDVACEYTFLVTLLTDCEVLLQSTILNSGALFRDNTNPTARPNHHQNERDTFFSERHQPIFRITFNDQQTFLQTGAVATFLLP
jgi:hypothetical protein